VALVLLALLVGACPGGSSPASSGTLLIVVNAPFSTSPYVGQTIERGVRLAADQINAKGGIDTGAGRYRLRIERLDNGLSPTTALENIRKAVAEKAVAVVDEGTGIDATWQEAAAAKLPVCIANQGGVGLVDAQARPNVFRIGPTDHGVAFRLAEYLVPKGLKVALLHDDTDYGQQGSAAFEQSFGRAPDSVVARATVPAAVSDPSPQVLQARRAGATALLVWAHGTTIAKVTRAARSSGWDVPIFTPPSGQDPVIRQELSDHPEWVDGLTFASGRMTAERGPGPFLTFQRAYEKAFGPDEVGVKTAEGKPVLQPPEFPMYAYDFVNVLAAAIRAAHGPDPAGVLAALNQVDVRGANGDERGFNERNHEGVVDDDVYFAVFNDMTYAPVKDDPLSATLDLIPQTR
jgi:ABC-type branched-subunit amino acid transport system substrate-binding protein